MASKKQFPLSIVIGAVDRVTAPMQRIQVKLRRFMVPVERLRRSLRRLGDAAGFRRMGLALGRVRTSMGNLVSTTGQLLTRLTAIGAAGAALASKLVLDFAKSGDAVAKFSGRIGVSAEWLQEMEYAADRSGVSVETLRMALQRAGRRIGQFVTEGKGEAAPILRAMGIETRNAAGELRGLEEMFPEILAGLAKIRNEGVRNAAAMKLFDTEGVAVVQMLKEGVEGVERLRAEARRLGLVISNEDAAAAETFTDRLTDMKGALAGVRNMIGSALMPILQEFITRLTGFVVENRGQIEAWAKQFAASLPTFNQVRDAVMRVVDELRPLMNLIRWISDNLGVVNTLLILFSVTMGGKFVLAILQAAAALKALGVAIALTPVGWFLAAVAAIATAVFLIYKNWDGIVEFFKSRFERVKAAFKDGFLKGLWTLAKEMNPISVIIDSVDALIEKLTGFSIKGAIKGLVSSLNPFSDNSEQSMQRPAPIMRPGAGVMQSSRNGEQTEARVLVDFTNLPRGVRVERDRSSTADLDLSMGYQLQGAQ